ncbi:MAG: Rieske (2Fe-2S) protein [Polyangia bacterium]
MADSRRSVLGMIVGAATAGLALVYAIPAAIYLRRRRSEGEIASDLGPLAALPERRPVRLPVIAERTDAWSHTRETMGSVFVVRTGSDVRVLDSACPHTGCSVDWDEQASAFRCPCHRSTFTIDGERTGGPAQRGLDPQEATVKGGRVLLRYRRYRSGRADRVPV